MKSYTHYKASGVPWLGDIPAHWDVVRLRFRCDSNPSVRKALDDDAVVSFVPMEAIGEDGSLNLDQTRVVQTVSSGYTYFEDGDVTIAKITPCFENGKGAVMRDLSSGAGFGTTELIVLRPDTRVEPQWLYYFTQAEIFRKPGEAMMLGSGGQKRVPELFVRDYRAAFPPRVEQEAIARHLDNETVRVDTLIAEKRRLMETLRELQQSVISEVITQGLDAKAPTKPSGIVWLGSFPAHWEIKRLRYLLVGIEQGASPQCENRLAEDSEWGVLKAGACNGGVFRESEHKALPAEIIPDAAAEVMAGDVLMSRASGTLELVGSVAYVGAVRPRLLLSDKTFRLRLDTRLGTLGEWLAMALNTDAHRKQVASMVGGAEGMARNITTQNIKELWIAVPPPLEQAEIVEEAKRRVANIRPLIEHAKAEITLLQELRAATITEAVLGRVQVVRSAEAA